ncbi:MAG: regulator of sigma E protease [Hyphomonadaceae bacterium]|nr:MAG: regulator of sigma E protease [Hyphomonadaceae bacterium]KAF0185423.1 MAG: regulator of sigma E protease [Hyphomonadaceae bacterium]
MLDTVFSILIGLGSFVAVLSLVVFVHEYGHYRVAKSLKVAIEKFSIGFGPQLFARTAKDGVLWRIGALPLGGYVKFSGDLDESSFGSQEITEEAKAKNYFYAKPVWVRALVSVAGPLANFVFAILVFSFFFMGFGETFQKPYVAKIEPNSAAAHSQLQIGDIIVAVNGKEMSGAQDLRRTILTAGGQQLTLKVKREDAEVLVPIVPKIVQRETPFGDMESQGLIGVGFGDRKQDIAHVSYNPIQAVGRSFERCGEIVSVQIKFIGALFRGAMSAGHLSGPLGIAQTAGMVANGSLNNLPDTATVFDRLGNLALSLIELAAFLSIAVGFMNLLPLPILDGGHLVFYAIEAIRGKPVSENIQLISYKVGFVCLMMLFVFATFQDLDRFGLFNGVKAIAN